ncbi:MAG: hypothetical protein M0R80_31365 [Proteobacteria bacterium]|jgi:hypothetical protein|nr:hypothetical protein [Pseudomonadota bacterium]
MRIEIYLEENEHEYIKSMGKGYIRTLVQKDMGYTGKEIRHEKAVEARSEARTIIKKAKVAPREIDTKKIRVNTCKYEGCGALLPYFGAKVCKACKGKQ